MLSSQTLAGKASLTPAKVRNCFMLPQRQIQQISSPEERRAACITLTHHGHLPWDQPKLNRGEGMQRGAAGPPGGRSSTDASQGPSQVCSCGPSAHRSWHRVGAKHNCIISEILTIFVSVHFLWGKTSQPVKHFILKSKPHVFLDRECKMGT